MGYAFTFTFIQWLGLRPITRLATTNPQATSTPIGAYVHYPTMSINMLNRVKTRQPGVTNDTTVTNSSWRTSLKLLQVVVVFIQM